MTAHEHDEIEDALARSGELRAEIKDHCASEADFARAKFDVLAAWRKDFEAAAVEPVHVPIEQGRQFDGLLAVARAHIILRRLAALEAEQRTTTDVVVELLALARPSTLTPEQRAFVDAAKRALDDGMLERELAEVDDDESILSRIDACAQAVLRPFDGDDGAR